MVIEAWELECPDFKPPSAKTILALVKKFHHHGTIKDLPRANTKKGTERESAIENINEKMFKKTFQKTLFTYSECRRRPY